MATKSTKWADDTADSKRSYQARVKIAADRVRRWAFAGEVGKPRFRASATSCDGLSKLCCAACISAWPTGQPQQRTLMYLIAIATYGRTLGKRKSWTLCEECMRIDWKSSGWRPREGGGRGHQLRL
jgi:hypothetical protein